MNPISCVISVGRFSRRPPAFSQSGPKAAPLLLNVLNDCASIADDDDDAAEMQGKLPELQFVDSFFIRVYIEGTRNREEYSSKKVLPKFESRMIHSKSQKGRLCMSSRAIPPLPTTAIRLAVWSRPTRSDILSISRIPMTCGWLLIKWGTEPVQTQSLS